MLRAILQSLFIAAIAMTILPPPSVHAKEPGAHPKVGLVLSGGGARGAAHVGVLRVLEELNVPIHCIVGTSMGSIVGGLYASGISVDDLEQIAVKTDWDGLFTDSIPRRVVNYRDKSDWPNYITSLNVNLEEGIDIPQGLIKGKRLDLMLRSLTLNAPKDFDDFPIPYRAIASDIETGDYVVLSKGDLARSLRASMAIPGAFAPVEIDGKLLVDGGVANNLAIDVAKQMGADVVIAVNIGTPLSTRKDLDSFLGIIDQITNILTNKNVEAQLRIMGPEDTLLTPELGAITTASFEKMGEAIDIGEKTTRDSQEDLSRYATSADEYQSIRSGQLKKAKPIRSIDFVRMDQESILGSDILLNLVTRRADTVLNKDVMAYNIFELYKRSDFEDVDFEVVEENGKQGLLIKGKKREQTENIVDLGLELGSTVQKENFFRFVARYRVRNLNSLGGEWKNEFWMGQNSRFFTEFYQPLNPYVWHFFLAPGLEYENYPVDLYRHYTDSNAFATYRLESANAMLDLGLAMGEYGETRFGYVRGKTESNLETGTPYLPEEDSDNGAYRISFRLDQLDSPFFPTEGGLFSVRYLYGREKLGDDENHESVETSFVKPFTYDMHTIALKARFDTNFDSTESLERGFALGGLFNLSGLLPYQVYGNTLAFAGVIYSAKVMKLSQLIGSNLYAGASLEAGNVWFRRSDINSNDLIYAGSVFVGMDSNIGPIYIGFGHAEGGLSALYFSLGARQY